MLLVGKKRWIQGSRRVIHMRLHYMKLIHLNSMYWLNLFYWPGIEGHLSWFAEEPEQSIQQLQRKRPMKSTIEIFCYIENFRGCINFNELKLCMNIFIILPIHFLLTPRYWWIVLLLAMLGHENGCMDHEHIQVFCEKKSHDWYFCYQFFCY